MSVYLVVSLLTSTSHSHDVDSGVYTFAVVGAYKYQRLEQMLWRHYNTDKGFLGQQVGK